jgi:Fic family protein
MFTPKYHISQKLLENIKHVAVLIQELNNKSFPSLMTLEFERRARELSAYSSTSIEGNPLPLTEVKKILKHTPAHIRDTEREVLNYNKALEDLNTLAKSGNLEISVSLILSIQKKVTEGLLENHRSGKLRTEPVFVNDPRTRSVAYLPPEVGEVSQLFSELVSFSIQNENILDPLILAGLFHKQFVVIHPFADGNGRTARLASKALLAKMGLDTFNLFSFENYYNKNVTNYFSKVGLMGNYYDIRDSIDFTEWLEYFTDGIVDELLRVKKEIENTTQAEQPRIRPELALLIDYARKRGTIDDKEYSELTKRAKSTRTLDFKHLVEQGFFEREGKGKNTFYRLKKDDK